MTSTRTKTNGIRFAAALSGLLVMMTAVPAFAGHEDDLRRGDRQSEYACGIDGCTDRHLGSGICHAKREYDRGQALGYREGKDRGYRDAAWCNPFCDGIPRRLKRYSRFFAAGYVDAYPVAYRKGFYHQQTAPRRRGIGRGIGRGNGRGYGRGVGGRYGRRGSWRYLGGSWGR